MAERPPEHEINIVGDKIQTRRAKWFRIALFVLLTSVVGGGTLALGGFYYFGSSVPEFTSMADYKPKIGSRIYAADNQLIGEFSEERRVLLPFDKIPKRVWQAFVSAEDKRFFKHKGLDYFGILNAILQKLFNPSKKLRGASTITQQAAKSLLVSHESYASATARTLTRKIREAILARRLEENLEKEEILYIYLNQIFLGHKAYGVQAAAEHYFKKDIHELNLAEAATLAGLPQRPSDYSPFSRPEAAHSRRRYVVRRMLEDGYIRPEEAHEAINQEIKVYPRREHYLKIAPYYTEEVRQRALKIVSDKALLEEGLHIYSGVHLDYQYYAQEALYHGLYALDRRQGYRGALHVLKSKEEQELFVEEYRKSLKLNSEEELVLDTDKVYLGVVTGFEKQGDVAVLNVAGLEGALPLAGMRWARKPNPTQRVDFHYVRDVRHVLKRGAVVSVRLTSRRKLSKDKYGWEVLSTVPKKGHIFTLKQQPIAQAALLSVDPNSGYVVAQVGGYDFRRSKYNRAMQACREPGSAFKPVVYSAALDKKNFTASTLVDDKPLIFDDAENAVRWKPNNAGQEFRGELPLRTCLKDSINTPAIRIAQAVGMDDIIANARALGLTTPLKRELGTALGSSCTTLDELINVYSTLSQYGVMRDKIFIRRIVNRHGEEIYNAASSFDPAITFGSRIDRAMQTYQESEKRAFDKQTAFLMVRLLRNVVEDGTAIAASRLNHFVAGKTGTTNDAFDAWFMGFTRDLVTGVWVGHDKKERPLGVSEQGGRTALPIWMEYTGAVLADFSGEKVKARETRGFDIPSGIIQVKIDPDTGMLARPEATRFALEYYRAGSEPTEVAPDQAIFDAEEMDLYEADIPL
ncbi:MAG: PBP1A family penicillin-binding protein [Myxococcota bacterium]|jgi:penicillin-binding protein 1A|nr:PBP1A family penicillin-binding protein [Myxococcota bacterium]